MVYTTMNMAFRNLTIAEAGEKVGVVYKKDNFFAETGKGR